MSIKINTRAVRNWLAAQRRMCVNKGFHTFRLAVAGKCTIEQAVRFFGQCDDVVANVRRNPDDNFYVVHLARVEVNAS